MNDHDITVSVLESFLEGKYPDQSRCEDAVFIGDSFIAVPPSG